MNWCGKCKIKYPLVFCYIAIVEMAHWNSWFTVFKMVIFQFAFCRFTTSHLETVNIHTTRLGPFKTGADWRCAIFASLIGLTTLPGFIIYIYIPHEQVQLRFPQNQLQNLNGKLNKGQKLTINCTCEQFCSSPCLAARRSWHCPRKCLPKAGWLDVFFGFVSRDARVLM